jgi:hypothetical protein
MSSNIGLNKKISSKVEIEYSDFATLPPNVREKFENLPTKMDCRNRTRCFIERLKSDFSGGHQTQCNLTF